MLNSLDCHRSIQVLIVEEIQQENMQYTSQVQYSDESTDHVDQYICLLQSYNLDHSHTST